VENEEQKWKRRTNWFALEEMRSFFSCCGGFHLRHSGPVELAKSQMEGSMKFKKSLRQSNRLEDLHLGQLNSIEWERPQRKECEVNILHNTPLSLHGELIPFSVTKSVVTRKHGGTYLQGFPFSL
jgi:hypothetical protein